MNFDSLSKEQQIMVVMRKVLTQIVKETAPQQGRPSPFSEETIEDIRMCLGLISSREQELLVEAGIENNARPHFIDEEKQNAQVISLDEIKAQRKS